ncbi:MAG: rod shape-determining protein MreC [Bacteroidetes bacterium]|nr:MAG: rod shape-determining protein MreC [Bacteroidota bacterium]REK04960.1 MAG: rod shape-determining protein MreC [Bacteroidota bacterium]REK36536.1 MAG: rod shape-determining protein MreC [Bacteroidota bacterium]REK50902.1 MAG: rod shape-determining protein MreC [Bacteroidota bacterium]
MRNLFLFLWRYNFFIFFLLLEVLCGYLIIRNKSFQRSSFVNSASQVSARVNSSISGITEYINLKNANEALARENAGLKSLYPDVYYVDSALKRLANDTIYKQQYTFITARVINNSVNRRNNYLTLSRGEKHGVAQEMGVITSDGIVGIVKDVSEHYSSVMSILHKDSRISARIKKSGYIGSFVWGGYDPFKGELKDIAKHVKVMPGDTIVTSAFSAIFPEGIMIGTVNEVNTETGSNFQEISVNLSVNYGSLRHVYIVQNNMRAEQINLEENQHDN